MRITIKARLSLFYRIVILTRAIMSYKFKEDTLYEITTC